MNVQAYILTLTYHTTLEEIIEHVLDRQCDIITGTVILCKEDVDSFVAPKWAAKDDIVFFYLAKSALQTIRKLKRECEKLDYSYEYKKLLQTVLNDAENIASDISGCIFAVGRVCGNAKVGERYEHSHFKNNIFADITDFVNLDTVIPLECFSEYAPLEFKKSITPVLGESFEQLKNDILEDSEIDYLVKSHSVPTPLKDISDKNWIVLNMDYRRKYFLEIQFRKYYVDYFLKVFGDQKKLYAECNTCRKGYRTGIADNCIKFNRKFAFVEVKLSVKSEYNLNNQLDKYCFVDSVKLSDDKEIEKGEIIQDAVFLVDVFGFYVYNARQRKLKMVGNLDKINSESDIKLLREKCVKIVNSSIKEADNRDI